jgi:hypothetical protein
MQSARQVGVKVTNPCDRLAALRLLEVPPMRDLEGRMEDASRVEGLKTVSNPRSAPSRRQCGRGQSALTHVHFAA